MAEETTLELKIRAAESAQTLGELKQSVTDLKAEIEGVELGSEEFNNLSQSILKADSKVRDLEKTFEGLDADKVASEFGRLTGGITSGFAAAQSAAILFGEENQELQEALVKAQAATALALSARSAGEAFLAGRILARYAAEKLGITATIAATKALSGFQKAMLGTGIGLFVAAIGALVANWDKLTGKIEDSTKASREFFNSLLDLEEFAERQNKEFDNTVAILKEQGASEEEINKILVDRIKDQQFYNDIKLSGFLDAKNSEEGLTEEQEKQYKIALDREAALKRELALLEARSERLKRERKEEEADKAEEKRKEALDKQLELEEQHKEAIKNLRDIDDDLTAKSELEKLELDTERKRKQIENEYLHTDQLTEAKSVRDHALAELEEEYYLRLEEINTKNLDEQAARDVAEYERRKALREKELAEEMAIANAKITIARNTASVLGSISILLEGRQKKATALSKIATVAQIAISTAEAIAHLTKSTEAVAAKAALATGGVGATIAAVSFYTTGIARIFANVAAAKQALSQAPGGGGAGISAPRPGLLSIPTGGFAPQLPEGQSGPEFSKTEIDEETGEPIKVYVLESDITGSQKRVKLLEKKSKTG